jgi:hypothetical protein
MGSWSNSLHIRHDESTEVVDALRSVLSERGYAVEEQLTGGLASRRPAHAAAIPFTGSSPGVGTLDENENECLWEDEERNAYGHDEDKDSDWQYDGRSRRIWVARPYRGWVGVLDSEIDGADELAGELSGRLATDAAWVMVNDSDGWLYSLYRRGRRLDAFDSLGDDGSDECSPELAAALARGDEDRIEDLLEKELAGRALQGPITLPDGFELLPFDLCRTRTKILRGRANWWERMRYRWWWVKFFFRLLTGRIGRPTAEWGFDIPRREPLTDAELDRHVAAIGCLFPQADKQAIRELLLQNRFPSEGQLEKFLKLVGLPPVYAYLSYDYLEDFGEDELLEKDVVLAAELRLTLSIR